MKKLVSILSLSLLALSSAALAGSADAPPPPKKYTYGLHLFFDEKEFVDVLTLVKDEGGKLRGHMSVPNDFEAEIEDVRYFPADPRKGVLHPTLKFTVLVPKNRTRPTDMVFLYEGHFFDDSLRGMTGTVRVDADGNHRSPGMRMKTIAGFVAYLRK